MADTLMKVLIVDDSEATRELLSAVVESYAAQAQRRAAIQAVGSGLEALRVLPANPLDLIITDINMPDINGLELIAFARQHPLHQQTPLIVVSTQSGAHDREKALSLGANAYCEKPVSLEALTAAIEPLLGQGGGQG